MEIFMLFLILKISSLNMYMKVRVDKIISGAGTSLTGYSELNRDDFY